MKLKYRAIILGVGLFLVIAFFYAVCDRAKLVDEISQAKGKYEVYRQIAITNEAISAKVIKEQLDKIDGLNGAIDSANTVIATLQTHQEEANETIGNLNNKLALAKTDAEKVPILTALVEEWSVKFYLAQDQLKEKDKVIFSLTEKYNAQLQISETYKADWTAESSLRTLAETRLNLMDKRISSLQTKAKLRNVGDVLLVAGALYLAFTK
jgi:chromosome segregation ATPase